MDNNTLLRYLQEGDEGAFTEIYVRFSERMMRYAFKRIQNREAAEEVIQDIFLSFWRNRSQGPDIQNLEVYLTSAVRYRCINYIVKARQQPVVYESYPESITNNADTDELQYKWLLRSLEKEMSRLPEKSRLIFTGYNENLSVSQLARLLGMTNEAVYKNLERTVVKLRKTMKQLLFIIF